MDSKSSLLDQDVPYHATVIIKRKIKITLSANTTKALFNKASRFITQTKDKTLRALNKGETSKSNKLFGVPLSEVLTRYNEPVVPLVKKCIEYVEKNGIISSAISFFFYQFSFYKLKN